MTTRPSFQFLLSVVTACVLASCSANTSQLGHHSDGGSGGQIGADAARDANSTVGGSGGGLGGSGGGLSGVGGISGTGGAITGGTLGLGGSLGGGTGGSVVDAPSAGGADGTTTTCASRGESCANRPCCGPLYCGNLLGPSTCLESLPPPVDSGAGGGSGGAGGGAGGTGGTTKTGGTGGSSGNGGMSGTGGRLGSGGATATGGTLGTGGATGTSYAGVLCGGPACNPGENCCVSQMLASMGCTTNTACDFVVTCDGPEDCGGAGHQCCMPSGASIQTACTTGSCLTGLAMCHTNADCLQGQSCCPATFMGYPYSACRTAACP